MTNEEKKIQEEKKVVDTGATTKVEGQAPTKTFTQEEVNKIVQDRLAKVYANYGVSNSQELDELVGKSNSYDELLGKYGDLESEKNGLSQRLAFINNNINPEREDDVLAYFKGKELEFNEENLKGLLDTHKEWVNEPKAPQTTVEVIGNGGQQVRETPTEKDIARKLFGFDF